MALILPNTIANDQDADGDKLQQNFATIQTWGNAEVITRDGSTAMTGALLLPGAPTAANQAATKGYVDAVGLIGEIKMWASQTAPTNFMFCTGVAVSRATYAALFTVLGTAYGSGDGSTTFNLPNMIGRSPMMHYPGGGFAQTFGANIGSENSTLPAHAHTLSNHTHLGADHAHADDHHHVGTTYGMDANNPHNHYIPGTMGTGSGINGGGYGEVGTDVGDLPRTGATDINHAHPFGTVLKSQTASAGNPAVNYSGSTALADRGLTTGGPSPDTTDNRGGSATNTNIHPVTVLNFIIKVL
jgi:microcystin-dependent protein